jgi:hypothetical protein
MSEKHISRTRAQKFAKSLLRRNDNGKGESWRTLAEEYGVNHATLNRIANSRGQWLPKDPEILKKLGLITERSPYAIMPRWWARTPEALDAFTNTRGKAKKLADDTREEQYKHRRK